MDEPLDLTVDKGQRESSLRQFGRETITYGFSAVVSRSLNLLMLPLYLYYLEPDEFGVVSLITAASVASTIVVSLGLHSAVPRWYWLAPGDDHNDRKRTVATAAWCQLGMAVGLACGVVLLAGPIASGATGDSTSAPYFRLVALAIPLTVFESNLLTWLRLQRRSTATVAFTILTALTTIGFAGVMVGVLQLGLWGVFGAALLARAASAAVAMRVLGGWMHPRHFARHRAREMLAYSWPWIPGDVAYWVIDLSDRFIIRYYWSEAEVGKYQMATTLAAATSLAVQAFNQAWLPFALSIKDRLDAEKVYVRVLSLYLAVVGATAIVTAAFVRDAITIVAPPVYLSATTAAGILAAGYVLRGARSVASTGTFIGGSQVGAVGALFVAGGVNVALNLAIVPRAGITGAAVSTMVAYAVGLVLTFRVAHRLHPIPYRYIQAGILILTVVAITWVRAATSSSFGLRDSAFDVLALAAFAIAVVAAGVIPLEQIRRSLKRPWRPRSD